jgi:GT2 family glycosyltransferase
MNRPRVLDDVTVVIPTLGRPTLEGCLESIAAGDSWPARLVAVDQGRSEQAAGWIESLRARGLDATHLPSLERGVSAGRNRGIEQARTRFFAITDDDCIVEPGWLEALTGELRERPAVVVTGRVDPGSGGEGEGQAVSLTRGTEPRTYTRPLLKEDILFAGNMGCAVETYRKIGPFDEAEYLRNAEDNDWAYRALRAGVPIAFQPAAGVRHLDWRTPEELLATYAGYAESQGGFYGKHLRRGDAFIALRSLITYARAARRTVAGTLRGDSLRRRHGWVTLKRLGPGILRGMRESS